MRDPAEHRATQVVTFPVEVDISSAPYAATSLLETLEGRPRVVIADLSLTEFCDTSGIRIRRTMHLADVDNVLRPYPTCRLR